MMTARMLVLLPCLLMSASVLADSAFESLEFAKQKQQIMVDLKKRCQPPTTISDETWANTILSSETNAGYVREAKLALERNNPQNYQAALDKVECPKF